MKAGPSSHSVSRQEEKPFRTEMPDDIDLECATAVAERARDLIMPKQAIQPSPTDIRVWFQYSLGISPEFNKIIGILIANNRRSMWWQSYLASGRPGSRHYSRQFGSHLGNVG